MASMARAGRNKRELTDRQKRFVEHYLIHLNGTKAAIEAGFSPRTAGKIAGQLLANPRIQAAIQKAMQARSQRTAITADRVLRELAILAVSDIGDVLDFSGVQPTLRPAHEISREARRAIASIKVRRHVEGKGDDATVVEVTEFKLWDKLSALDKLARHLGMYRDAVDVTTGGQPLEQSRSIADTVERYGVAIASLLAGASAGLPAPDSAGKPVDTGRRP